MNWEASSETVTREKLPVGETMQFRETVGYVAVATQLCWLENELNR